MRPYDQGVPITKNRQSSAQFSLCLQRNTVREGGEIHLSLLRRIAVNKVHSQYYVRPLRFRNVRGFGVAQTGGVITGMAAAC